MKKIFISWSGSSSKNIANALKNNIEKIFENEELTIFMSAADIESGTEWFEKIKSNLLDSDCAILILTKENLSAPWILFEAGAMAINYEETRIIPMLFDVKVDDKSPLSHYHHKKFNKYDFTKMILDIQTFCGFEKATKKQLNTLAQNHFADFSKEISEEMKKLKNSVFFGTSYIFPKNIRCVKKNSIFISSPMNSSKNDDEYREQRTNILLLKDKLSKSGFTEIIYPGDDIKYKSDFDGERKAINQNFKNIKSTECILAIYPRIVASSVLLEIGYGIALTKKIVIFTKNKSKLPFMLREADALNNIQIFEYKSFDDIAKRITSNGHNLFNIEDVE